VTSSPLKNVSLFLIGLAGVLVGGWFVLREPVGEDVPPTPRPVPTLTSEAAKTLIGFDLLGETYPDDNYLPVYPEALEKLDATPVTIRGFMTPYDSLEDMETFMIMPFPTGCNFCAPPSVDQVILVRQAQRDKPYTYIEGPIEVQGTLRLWSKESEDPAHKDEYFLYIMTDVHVSSIPPELFQMPEGHLQHTTMQPGT